MTIKNRILSNGLCVLNVKKKTNELVILALTDFNKTGRFLFDTVDKKVLNASPEMKLRPSDLDLIQDFIKNSEEVTVVVPVVKVETPAAVGF